MPDKKLIDLAKEQGKSYQTVYSQYKRGQLAGYKNEEGDIILGERPISQTPVNQVVSIVSSNRTPLEFTPASVELTDYKVSKASKSRRNASSTIERIDRYKNIESTPVPYESVSYGGNKYMCMREMIRLCQLAFYAYGAIRNHIGVLVDFSSSPIYLTGGSQTSRDFFNALFDKINLSSFTEQFFLEFWRSSNVFIYRFDGKLAESDITELTKVFGLSQAAKKEKTYTLPIKYSILNPADILLASPASMIMGKYFKILNSFEVHALKNPQTDQDRDLFKSLPPEVKKQIADGKTSQIVMELPVDKITTVFNKKQDYEGFAVSIIYPILDDLEVKSEMKKMDAALVRTTQQCILLITIGSELKDGTLNISQKNIDTLQAIFANESVGRVLVSDFTTKGQFIIPDIGSLLDPKKYEQIDKDIKEGLGAILLGSSEEKFANRAMSVQIFVERLIKSREAFLNNFLQPEIKRIAKDMGFKNYPTAHFKELNLKDELEFSKLYVRLNELGMLSPEETFEALESGRLPTKEESLESQTEYRKNRDLGRFSPIVSSPYDQLQLSKESNKNALKMQSNQQEHDDVQQAKQRKFDAANPKPTPSIPVNTPTKLKQPAGRPSGVHTPKTKQKITPIQGEQYSLKRIKENLILATKLQEEIGNKLKEKHKLESLSEKQTEICEKITEIIISNELPEKWMESIAEYIEQPVDKNPERIQELRELAYDHQVNDYLAALLLNSRIN